MRLKTKLVMAATGLTFAVVLVMSAIFVGELLRQRIEQTVSSNEVVAHQIVMVTVQALEQGLRTSPPVDGSHEALVSSVTQALQTETSLSHVMSTIVRYSPTVQDVSVTDMDGRVLLSTDPDAMGQRAARRMELLRIRDGSVWSQAQQVFGPPRVLDLSEPLLRNGRPFLLVHVGVRSTFLKASYEPWLRAAAIFALLAGLASMAAAALLANVALSPIEQISRKLEQLGVAESSEEEAPTEEPAGARSDAVFRVTRSIDRLGQQMRSAEAGYTSLQENLNQMLDTLRDGVLMFTADRRAVMVSDAVEHFLNKPESAMVGRPLEEIFDPETALGRAVLQGFQDREQVSGEPVSMEDGRQVQFSLDPITEGRRGGRNMGTLVTLRDTESAAQLGQELEVSRRLAAIGRLTAGVGHEVKNPINAMVVHLELLKGKLTRLEGDSLEGAQRHVSILAGEMQRLDRVVQALADFTRPMELKLQEHDLRSVVTSVVDLTGLEMSQNGVTVETEMPREPLTVRLDAELIRQALLNLLLNGMQAMPAGGVMRVRVRREKQFGVIEVTDEGEGIAQEVLPRIFELYFTTKAKGSGIGLAMTYRILQIHGGAMDVVSDADLSSPDHGTTFTVRLPVMSAGIGAEVRKAIGGDTCRRGRTAGDRVTYAHLRAGQGGSGARGEPSAVRPGGMFAAS